MAKPSSDPKNHAGERFALGKFYEAWVPEMERRHETFTTAFLGDKTYPGIVRVCMVLCPFVSSALSSRWHILDQNEAAAHNDKSFGLQRRLALLMTRHRDLDPLASDVLVGMLRINERHAGRHSLISAAYRPLDALAELHMWRIYGFADKVFRGLPQDEDLCAYEVGEGFVWPEPGPTGSPGRPNCLIPGRTIGEDAFDAAAILAMAGALEADGHPVTDIARAVEDCTKDIAKIHHYVRFVDGDAGTAPTVESPVAFAARRAECGANTAQALLGIPDSGSLHRFVIVPSEARDRLLAADAELRSEAGIVLLICKGEPNPEVSLRKVGISLLRGDQCAILGSSAHPMFANAASDIVFLLSHGLGVIAVDDDPDATRSLIGEVTTLLEKGGDPPPLDLRVSTAVSLP